MLIAAMVVSLASVLLVSSPRAQDAQPCDAIKKYLAQVEECATFSFGEDREKKLADAQKSLLDQLAKSKYSPSNELNELLAGYVSQTCLGHDKMRKGDASLLVKARATYDKIKSICPW
jgi:hypothetical protein